MGDDNNSITVFQIHRKFFYFHGGNRIQGAGGFVHQQDLRFHRQSPGNAETLLLTAGKTQRRFFQPILHFIPDGGVFQRSFHDLIEFRFILHAVSTGAVGHIVINTHGKGIGLLKDHADIAAKLVYINGRGKNIFASVKNVPLDLYGRHQIVHAIQCFQKSGFPAARRADQRGDAFFGNFNGNIFQGMVRAIPQIQLFRGNDIHNFFLRLKYLPTSSAATLMAMVSTIRMAAIAKATPNSPCSLA